MSENVAATSRNLVHAAIDLLPSVVTSQQGFWEKVLGHAIAWEYFNHDDRRAVFYEEVETGKRMYKFRHTNEFAFRNQVRNEFGGSPPSIVLGHTHEVRFRPAPGTAQASEPGGRFNSYYNCGSVGRFQNLLWCVEIDDGKPRVVSWSRPGGPASKQKPVRRVWEDIFEEKFDDKGNCLLSVSGLRAGPVVSLG